MITNRNVLIIGIALVVAFGAWAAEERPGEKDRMEANVPVRAITSGPEAHWFGYYDKHQFDPSNRYVLGNQVTFEDRAPTAEDAIELGMVDIENGDKWIPLATTTAWCWQQGCMLQWLPGSDSEIIYNVRTEDGYASVIQDVFTGEKRSLPHPIYTVSGDGKYAVSLNFARVGETRPGYGYNGLPDPNEDELYPADDGIYLIDIASGESKLIISLADIVKINPDDTMDKGKHWFNHLLFNQDGSRFIFLHRWHREDGRHWYTRGFTAQPDGSDIFCFGDHGMVSHFIWRDPDHILAWSKEPEGSHFHLYEDETQNVTPIGPDVLKVDGHCTYSPDAQWILTDTYPDRERMQNLMLYRPKDGKLMDLGRFYQERPSEVQLRCDLHPSWSRDGRYVCIDSKHSGQRQMYLLDVSSIVLASETE